MNTLEELRAKVAALLQKRADIHAGGEKLIEEASKALDAWNAEPAEKRGAQPAGVDEAKLTEVRDAKKALDAEVDELRGRISVLEDEEKRDAAAAELRKEFGQVGPVSAARVKSEPAIYTRSGQSWFKDVLSIQKGNSEAADRLTRNTRMVLESRAVDLNTTAGTGGEFAPPLWLIDEFIKLARPGRVTADLIGSRSLPRGVSSINLPKVATGAATAVQSTQGSSVQDTALTTSSVTSGILTVSGQQTASLQLLEQSGINFDEVILQDLAADYAVKLDTQVLTAAASAPWNGGGLANVSGAGAVTYTQASPTVAGAGQFYAQIAKAIQTVATARFMPPTAIVMHPRRWAWVTASFDSQNRPLVVPSGAGINVAALERNVDGAQLLAPVGEMQGLPVYTDANIPTNIGAGTNQDVVYVLREADLYLYETDLASASFDATFAGSLEMLFRVHAYAAAIFNRYASAICSINGTGLVTPSF